MKNKNLESVTFELERSIPLSPEAIIEWLEGHRQLMFEVWKENPELRKQWEKLNEDT